MISDDLRAPAAEAVRRTSLDSAAGVSWTLRAGDGPVPEASAALRTTGVPATVPGVVHTDLLAAGAIPDPFDGDNEALLAWIGRTDWTFTATFAWQPDGRARQELVAAGLDTVAVVRLNGSEVGRTANQHRTHRFDVTGLLREGDNEVVVEFESPVGAAERLAALTGPRPHVNHHPFNAIRKTASNYGWDWGIDVATAGIWRSLQVESSDVVRIAAVRPLAGVDGGDGVLTAHVDLDWIGGDEGTGVVRVDVAGRSGEAVVEAGRGSAVVEVRVPDAALWWPRGYGEQALHDVRVEVTAERGGAAAVDSWTGRVGFRTVELDTAPDEHGSPFAVSVNGRPVYVRGANWIPDDPFLPRIDRAAYERSIRDAVDAGMNLLRVWGGGIYESEDFYDLCDSLGILVWQDFLFACAAYSEEEPLRGEVEAEAREAVTRLSRHASLAVWNGCNENVWGYVEWAWRVPLAGRTWGAGYYFDLLPRLVAELDPRTPYSAASPFSFSDFLHPNDARHGTMHIWDVWNQVDYTTYRDYAPRFVSEFGFQGPPAWSTLVSVVHDEPLDPYGPQMLVHQKAHEGNLKLERGLGEHLPRWRDLDEWHWATQLNQARAIAYGIEHFRSLFPLNTGAVVWQLNDEWPVVSWAAVDSAGIRKPLWHALKRVLADRLLTVQPRDGRPALVLHNDSDEPWAGDVLVVRRGTGAGSPELAREVVHLEVAARSAATAALGDVAEPGDAAGEFLHATAAGAPFAAATWFFVEDTALEVRPREDLLDVEVERTAGGYDVRVAARALAKDVSLFPDRLDAAARVDSGLVTLVAGESHVFAVTCPELADPRALAAAPVLRTANDLLR